MTRARRSRGARARCDTSNLCSSPNPVSLKLTEITIGRFQTPCFTSPQTVHIRVRILNLFHRALLWHFIAYHHAKKTLIHLLATGLTMSIRSFPSRQEDAYTSSCRRSNYEWIKSVLLKSKDHACP